MLTDTDLHALEHFISLARAGKRPGCSPGEFRARQLAEAALAHASGLDDLAVDGFAAFAHVAAASYTKAKELLS